MTKRNDQQLHNTTRLVRKCINKNVMINKNEKYTNNTKEKDEKEEKGRRKTNKLISLDT